MSEPVKITPGTRVIGEIGGADFDIGTVMRLELSPVDYHTTRVANPDGTFAHRTVGATMRLELLCDLPITVEP
ncbi:MAG: hypothetical protein ACK6EB_05980 [Planctomyces sp.]